MAHGETPASGPDWDCLYEAAAAQSGYFTTAQAAEAGYSSQLLHHYLRIGRMARVRRGVYRLVHFPPGDHEDLVALWLWSEQAGVFSHETALSLHCLSDVLPAKVHLTLPVAWKHRRFRVPKAVILYHADVEEPERAWVDPVPLTSPLRTLLDCAAAHVSPETIAKAIRDALERGLVARRDIATVMKDLREEGVDR